MKRILVVDDNVDGATSLQLYLEMLGHQVRIAHTGLEALEYAHSEMPQVIFLDIGLPGMNGYEVARFIRAMPTGVAPRIFAVTGWGSDNDKKLSAEAGCDAHLIKPVDLQEIEKLLAG